MYWKFNWLLIWFFMIQNRKHHLVFLENLKENANHIHIICKPWCNHSGILYNNAHGHYSRANDFPIAIRDIESQQPRPWHLHTHANFVHAKKKSGKTAIWPGKIEEKPRTGRPLAPAGRREAKRRYLGNYFFD